MITKIQLGEKSKDCLLLKFGSGDIMFSGIKTDNIEFALAFNEHEARKIGETTNEYQGKTTDDFPTEVKMIMQFERPESITAVIHSLIELQKLMFDSIKVG